MNQICFYVSKGQGNKNFLSENCKKLPVQLRKVKYLYLKNGSTKQTENFGVASSLYALFNPIIKFEIQSF